MTPTRARTLLRERRAGLARGGDEGVALLLVLMTMAIAATLSLLVLGVVLSQVQPTQMQQKTTRTVAAAQAGVDAALAQIRTAEGTATVVGRVGDPTKLPCEVTGTVGDNADGAAFRVTISYFDTNPSTLTRDERALRDITCTPGQGTGALVPSFAVLSSAASGKPLAGRTADSGDRSMESLYAFEISNENVPGGRMFSVNQKFCLTVASPAVGVTVTYTAAAGCPTGGALTSWVYDKDYALKLASTLTGTPLCISAPLASGVDATLQTCAVGDLKQQWSYEGGARFRGQKAAAGNGTKNSSDYGAYCLTASTTDATKLQGARLQSGTCSSDTEHGSFSPDPSVGAGAASVETQQIVNYLEFGRCMDVTKGDLSYAYMIVYPCKQDPSGGTKLSWNHKWSYVEPAAGQSTTAPQRITVTNGGTYCLQVPAQTVVDGDVTFTSACSATEPRQQIVRTYAVPGSYTSSYTFTDTWGRCLSLGPKKEPSVVGVKWSTIVAAACTGGSEQKWNAPASGQKTGLTGTRETTYDQP
ncbi:hypothetical protein GTR02_07690 [Kineococcus sp. R8]|uniref:RICIN domain-containing protein n=1 Tax=Kineococcus siccus TaxID=2696567 RepID=UPI0014133903|nr:hypothetical protein [Kineococcus siccus]NAZ81699.1 hypothetical protein [Kineococcus siccus]